MSNFVFVRLERRLVPMWGVLQSAPRAVSISRLLKGWFKESATNTAKQFITRMVTRMDIETLPATAGAGGAFSSPYLKLGVSAPLPNPRRFR